MTTEKTRGRQLPYRDLFAFVHEYLMRAPRVYAGIVVSGILMAASEIAIPIVTEHLIRAASDGNRDVDRIIHIFLIFAAVYLSYWIVRYSVHFVYARMMVKRLCEMLLDSFARVQSFSAQWHMDSFAGSTVRDISRGTQAFESFMDIVAFTMYQAILILIGIAGYLFYKWPVVGACFSIFSLLFLGVTGTLALRFVGPRNRAINQADTELGGALSDAVSCNMVVRSFGLEDTEYQRLATVLEGWRKKMLTAWFAALSNGMVQVSMILLGRFAFVGWTLYGWAHGTQDAASVVFAIMISGMFNSYLRDFGYQLRTAQKHLNEMEAIVVFSKTKPAIQDAQDAAHLHADKGVVEFKNVAFSYLPERPLFSDLSLRVENGQMVALVGTSGSGKSTFVKLIQRFYDVTGGAIMIDGQDIRAVTQQSLRRAIAVVPQEPILFHRSIFDNIAYARSDASREDVLRAAKLANAAQFIQALPNGFDTMVGERGVKLSGGERQRVAIARAILADAPILILDEATSSLDSVSERLIQRSMGDLTRGRTTFVIAHRLSTIQAADRILVFADGRIVEDGTHEELLENANGRYRALYETQYHLEHEGV